MTLLRLWKPSTLGVKGVQCTHHLSQLSEGKSPEQRRCRKDFLGSTGDCFVQTLSIETWIILVYRQTCFIHRGVVSNERWFYSSTGGVSIETWLLSPLLVSRSKVQSFDLTAFLDAKRASTPKEPSLCPRIRCSKADEGRCRCGGSEHQAHEVENTAPAGARPEPGSGFINPHRRNKGRQRPFVFNFWRCFCM